MRSKSRTCERKSGSSIKYDVAKSTIYSEYIDSQQDQVEKHKQDLLNKNKEEAQLQENEFHKSMKNMEDLFTQNKDKWVDEIFTRCTK